MRKNAKKTKKIVFMVLGKGFLVFLLVLVIMLVPTVGVVYKSNKESLQNKFLGKIPAFQGIITLWNIDTFEGGSASRSFFLEKVCAKFEKTYKGVFIKVENLTIDEMNANINNGKYPNLFSFGTGVSGLMKDKMIALPDNFSRKIKPNFYTAGLDGTVLKAIPWCYSGYTLISSLARIEKAGKTYNSDLKSLAFDLAFDTKLKKKTKHTYSLTFGGNVYTNALNVVSRVFTNSVIYEAEKGNLDEKYNSQSSFDAYSSFVGGKASMLLGMMRDVFRMENRIMAGKESDVIYQPLSEYTDLVQYISIVKSDEKIVDICLEFVKFLLSDDIQQSIRDIGLFSSTLTGLYEDGVIKEFENAITENTIVKSVF